MTEKVAKTAEAIVKDVEAIASESATAVTGWLSHLETYYQLGAIGVALMLGLFVASAIRKRIRGVQEPTGGVIQFSGAWFKRRSGRLIGPVLTLALLMLSEYLLAPVLENVQLIDIAERIALGWLMWVFLKAFVTNALVRASSTLLLVPAAMLHLFDYYDTAQEFLNGYGFTVGDVSITAYTFLKALLLITVVLWIGKLIGQTAEGLIRNSQSLTRPTQELMVKIFDIVLYAALFMVTLNVVGIDLTALAVFSGALGVGLGFGLQKIASNFISGIILLMEKSVNINNLIEMDDGIYGYVRKLGARASIVETLEGTEVMVPNEDFITSRVTNLTHSTKSFRVDIPIGVSYGSDMHQVREILLEATNSCSLVSKDPTHKVKCLLREFGDSSVNFMVMFWMDDIDVGRWVAQDEVMFAIWDALKENDVEIPFPQRDIHIRTGLEGIEAMTSSTKKPAIAKAEKKALAKKPAKRAPEKGSAENPSE